MSFKLFLPRENLKKNAPKRGQNLRCVLVKNLKKRGKMAGYIL